jgi:hypothetical protein
MLRWLWRLWRRPFDDRVSAGWLKEQSYRERDGVIDYGVMRGPVRFDWQDEIDELARLAEYSEPQPAPPRLK